VLLGGLDLRDTDMAVGRTSAAALSVRGESATAWNRASCVNLRLPVLLLRVRQLILHRRPVGGRAAPVGRAPDIRTAPRAEQLPSTAGESSTVAATVGAVAWGALVGAAPPAPEARRALRPWKQTPTTMSESFAATVLVKVVLAEEVTAVWALVP